MQHILIVEDNRDIAVLYKRALFRYEQTIVDTAEKAIKLLAENKYDMVVLDMHLPEDSGLSVLKFVRDHKKDNETKILVISADDMFRKECLNYGIQGWMTKPIELDLLMDTVDQQLEQNHV